MNAYKRKIRKQKLRVFISVAASLFALSVIVSSVFTVVTFNTEKQLCYSDASSYASDLFAYLENRLANEREYADYKMDNIGNSSFMTKRMNRPVGETESGVTDWENIAATNKELPDLSKYACIGGIDYSRTTDFVAAGLLFEVDGEWKWITHSWVCRQSKDWSRIKYPIEEAEAKGLLTIVNAVEIPPELVADWFANMSSKYNIVCVAYDSFRHTLIEKAMREAGFDTDKDGNNNIKLIRPSDIMKVAPLITSQFVRKRISWGDNSLMRWYTNNAKVVLDARSNISYGKIEPKSRKTDGFMAFVAAATQINTIQGWNDRQVESITDVYIY